MGCDIHNHVEVLKGDKWRCADAYFLNYKSGGYMPEYFCDDRRYTLFSILANVRNNGEIPCISEPRDIPDDVTDVVWNEYESWGSDAHSASYLTLKELIEFREEHKDQQYVKTMDELILKLKIRADTLSVIPLWAWETRYEVAIEDASKVRLVFWFDN